MSKNKDLEEQRVALAVVMRYFLYRSAKDPVRKNKGMSRVELGRKARLDGLVDEQTRNERNKLDAKLREIMGNLLNAVADTGFAELKGYFGELLKDRNNRHEYFKDCPDFIEATITALFPTEEKKSIPRDHADFDELLRRLRYATPADQETLSTNYKGIWDIVRYSAHEPERDKGTPYLVRAAMEVFPMNTFRGEDSARFLIHYRPAGATGVKRAMGYVVLVNGGAHMAFVGREVDDASPICIVAKFQRETTPLFHAIVVRKHSEGRVFASGVCFIRSKSEDLASLKPKIKTYLEDDLRKDIALDHPDLLDDIFKSVMNNTNNGRGVLFL